MSRRTSSGPLVALLALVLATLSLATLSLTFVTTAAVGASYGATSGSGDRTRVSQRSQDQAPEPSTDTTVLPARCLEAGETMPSRAGACVITDFGARRPTVVVWGDSHAWQQLPALEAQARRTRTNLVAFVMGACPPMDLRGTAYRGACTAQTEAALRYVTTAQARGRSVKVVLGAFWELYRGYHRAAEGGYAPTDPHERFLVERAAAFDVGGARLFGTLARRDVATAAIAQAPWVGSDVAPCAAGEEPYACDLPRETAIPAEAATARWVQHQLDRIRISGYIDPTRFLCGPEVCRAELDGEPVFLDDLHLDPAVTGAFAPEYHDLFA